MYALVNRDIYASELDALPLNVPDYVIIPQGAAVEVGEVYAEGVDVTYTAEGCTWSVGLTLALDAVNLEGGLPEPVYEEALPPPLPAYDASSGRYTGWW